MICKYCGRKEWKGSAQKFHETTNALIVEMGRKLDQISKIEHCNCGQIIGLIDNNGETFYSYVLKGAT